MARNIPYGSYEPKSLEQRKKSLGTIAYQAPEARNDGCEKNEPDHFCCLESSLFMQRAGRGIRVTLIGRKEGDLWSHIQTITTSCATHFNTLVLILMYYIICFACSSLSPHWTSSLLTFEGPWCDIFSFGVLLLKLSLGKDSSENQHNVRY